MRRGQRRGHPLHDGLVTRREYLEVPVRVEYGPTDSCRALLPILEQLSDWAEARM